MHHASLQFDDQPILKDFNWLVQPGTRIGITGKNGAGKSTLLNIIAGKQKLDSGSIELGETVHLGYYTQMSANLDRTNASLPTCRRLAKKSCKQMVNACQ